VLGPDVNIQAPPNLSPRVYPRLLAAGSTTGAHLAAHARHINPEKRAADPRAPACDESQGFVLRERLAIYPESRRDRSSSTSACAARGELIDERGLVKESHEHWRRW